MNRFTRNCALALTISAVAIPASANHKWNRYHWETATGTVEVPVIDHTDSKWTGRVADAVNDWNDPKVVLGNSTTAPDVINATYVGAGYDAACNHVLHEIHVCNDAYGDVGWLGIASISIGVGRHIVAGSTKLNDTYFDGYPFYNTDVWRQLVTCQEIGHDFGLGHQNENFSTNLTDSCMEYTNTPTAIDKTPDFHDYEMLGEIYAHDATTDGGGTGPGKGGNGGGKKPLGISPGNSPADWGTPVQRDARGNPSVYMRNEGGLLVVTHVTWAIGEGPAERGHRH